MNVILSGCGFLGCTTSNLLPTALIFICIMCCFSVVLWSRVTALALLYEPVFKTKWETIMIWSYMYVVDVACRGQGGIFYLKYLD